MRGVEGFSLGHLWFLYYLALISALAVAVRGLALRLPSAPRVAAAVDRGVVRVAKGGFAPLVLALLVWPCLFGMPRYDVDSPVTGFWPHGPALAVFALYFAAGWWLYRQRPLLARLAARWRLLLLAGLLLSLVAWAGEAERVFGRATPLIDAGARFAAALTMSLSTLGWVGLFAAVATRPSPRVRWLADASYWMYLAHLPLVVALQVAWAEWDSTWLKLLAITALSVVLLLASYGLLIRGRWPGRWLGGARPAAAPAFGGP